MPLNEKCLCLHCLCLSEEAQWNRHRTLRFVLVFALNRGIHLHGMKFERYQSVLYYLKLKVSLSLLCPSSHLIHQPPSPMSTRLNNSKNFSSFITCNKYLKEYSHMNLNKLKPPTFRLASILVPQLVCTCLHTSDFYLYPVRSRSHDMFLKTLPLSKTIW